MGKLSENGYDYSLGITPEDPKEPDCCYFNIWVEKIIFNETTKTTVFQAKTYSCFKVKNNFEKPSPEFYFKLFEIAVKDFVSLYFIRTKKSNPSPYGIKKPIYLEVKEDLERTIEYWDKNFNIKNIVKPNWQEYFRDFPPIPQEKKWVEGSRTTKEQDIIFKILKNKPISDSEEKLLIELAIFYQILNEKL